MTSIKYLAHYIIYKNVVHKQSVCSISADNVNIYPFSEECSNTIFVNGIVIIGNSKLPQFKSKINSIILSSINFVENINSFMAENNLNHNNTSPLEFLVINFE